MSKVAFFFEGKKDVINGYKVLSKYTKKFLQVVFCLQFLKEKCFKWIIFVRTKKKRFFFPPNFVR